MPNPRRAKCVCCGKHRDEVGELSWKGYCTDCGIELQAENAIGISTKTGPAHRRRMRGYAKWVEREALDARASAP
jgi:hypothetical protein